MPTIKIAKKQYFNKKPKIELRRSIDPQNLLKDIKNQ